MICPWTATLSALLSIGLQCNWLSLHIYSSKVQSTSKLVLNYETDSLSTTSSKCVDGVTKSAPLKQFVITDGENKFQNFLAITKRGTEKILVTTEHKKMKKNSPAFCQENFACIHRHRHTHIHTPTHPPTHPHTPTHTHTHTPHTTHISYSSFDTF